MHELRVKTRSRNDLVDITAEVQKAVSDSEVDDGVCLVFVPHTTAAVTINEGADPAVRQDIEAELDKVFPWRDGYAHAEGNARRRTSKHHWWAHRRRSSSAAAASSWEPGNRSTSANSTVPGNARCMLG